MKRLLICYGFFTLGAAGMGAALAFTGATPKEWSFWTILSLYIFAHHTGRWMKGG